MLYSHYFISKSLTKQTVSGLQLQLNGKQPYPADPVKYLAIIIDKNLNWHHQINNVASKLNRANTMLSKIRHIVNFNTIKSNYHAIFESQKEIFWAQNTNSIKKLSVLQIKSLRIMRFLKRNADTSNLFKNVNVLKFPDKVCSSRKPSSINAICVRLLL